MENQPQQNKSKADDPNYMVVRRFNLYSIKQHVQSLIYRIQEIERSLEQIAQDIHNLPKCPEHSDSDTE